MSREQVHFGFAAAHFLPRLPPDHKCRRLHGHSFRCVIDAPNAQPLLAPLADVHAQLDHRLLNDVPGLENPTSENLARWLWQELATRRALCEQLMIRETCTSACLYAGSEAGS
ncbi:MAG: 6-carboxytetrahydropterin synthase [Candidatus Zixiibacteriota bacterium]